MKKILSVIFSVCCLFSLFITPLNAKINIVKDAQKVVVRAENTRQSLIPCETCIDFFDDTLDDMINIVLNVGVGATCSDLCLQLSEQWEQGVCLLLCVSVGFDTFVDFLQNTDLDPIYLCSALGACPNNTCVNGCLNITSVEVQPEAAPVRTTFNVMVNFTVHLQTGTGITLAIVIPPPSVQEDPLGFAVLNEGYTPGDYSVIVPIETDWQDWDFPAGPYSVLIQSCGSDCDNEHGVVFDQAFTHLTITNSTTFGGFPGECGACKIAVEAITEVGCGSISSVCGPFEPACELVCEGACEVKDCPTWACTKIHACG